MSIAVDVYIVRKTLKNRGKVKIHTGHVDGFWKVLKQTIPGSLPSKKGQARNPQIWKCMRSFQWRWECTGKTWWKPPLTRWRKCEKKLRLPFMRLKWWKGCHSKSRRSFFFDRFRMLKSGFSLWGRRNFDHFLAPVTLPAGCICTCIMHLIYIYIYIYCKYIYIIHTYVDSEGELGVCCSKNASLFSLGCSTATQSHGNTRIVSSPTSKQYISSCKLISPHKRNDKYSAWELHDLNFSTAILHCLSKHSTGCILLSKVCFLLGFGYILKPISTIVMK